VRKLRQRLFDRRLLAAGLLAFALLIKLIVPTGYMLSAERGSLSVELCSGYAPAPAHAMAHHHQPKPQKAVVEMPCAFSALSAPALSSADPVLLAAAIPFISTPALPAPAGLSRSLPDYLRPPSRGPPLPA
jgi:hypothetical protein